jgi:hypothetical protein
MSDSAAARRGRRPAVAARSAAAGAAFLLAGALGGAAALPASAGEEPPYRVVDGEVDRSTFLGWRAFHSACHVCHGVDGTGTSVAPDLVARVRDLSARDFTLKVLTRYRIVVGGAEARAEGAAELRAALLEEVMKHERGELIMPAWEPDPNVKPHVLDLYAYLRARADGALGPGRPAQLSADPP